MKTILIVNTREKECAVWQYGRNLFEALVQKELFEPHQYHFQYCEPADIFDLVRGEAFDAAIYNWHPTQGGFLKDAPFDVGRPVTNLCFVHEMEWPRLDKFNACLFSRIHPTVPEHGRFRIPLLLPVYEFFPPVTLVPECPFIGVNGYGGAQADRGMERIVEEFDEAVVRLHLPPAHYGDADGHYARVFADRCREIARRKRGIKVETSHEWFDQEDLLSWISHNDMNVYLRDTSRPWHGVSAAMCAALVVKRPIATNRNPSFRHLWDCTPSVCVEDRSLKEILATGTKPLEPIYEANSTEKFVARIEEILGYVLK